MRLRLHPFPCCEVATGRTYSPRETIVQSTQHPGTEAANPLFVPRQPTVRKAPMTRLVRPLACAVVFLLAAVLWTCSGEHGTNPHGPATSLTFTTGPASVVAGAQIATVTVTALDANGHTATDFASAITV